MVNIDNVSHETLSEIKMDIKSFLDEATLSFYSLLENCIRHHDIRSR